MDTSQLAEDDLTVFKANQDLLRNKLKSATVDPSEFRRKLKRCALASCRGMCCYDGASVDDRTGEAVQELVDRRGGDFAAMGLNLPKQVIETTEWKGVVGKKTVVKPFPYRSLVNNYPDHFNETACVFLLDDGRCGLQILAEQDGKHPWYYKPFTCWLQPIKLSEGAIRLYDETNDPNKIPGYDGFVIRTHCGRTEECGQPAANVLRTELDFLGKIIGRDLVSEIQSQDNANQPAITKEDPPVS